MKNYDRYSVGYFPPATPHNEWVKKDHVEKAPTWSSVDLRDGNQALIVPMSLEEKEELFSINYRVEESVTDGEKTLSSENVKKQNKILRRGFSLSPLILLIALGFLILEWILYLKGN